MLMKYQCFIVNLFRSWDYKRNGTGRGRRYDDISEEVVEEQGCFVLFDLSPTHIVDHLWYQYGLYLCEYCHAGDGDSCGYHVNRSFIGFVLIRKGSYDAIFTQVVKGINAFFLLDLFPNAADVNLRYFYGQLLP